MRKRLLIFGLIGLVFLAGCTIDNAITDGVTEERLQMLSEFADNDNVIEHVERSNESEGQYAEFIFRLNNQTSEAHMIYNLVFDEFNESLTDEEELGFNMICQIYGATFLLGQPHSDVEIDEEMPEDVVGANWTMIHVTVQQTNESLVHECISTQDSLGKDSFIPGWLSFLV